MASKPTHLEPSELGTREYWDNLYTKELTNHAHDPSDTGTVWFDDSDAEAKVIEFLEDFAPEEAGGLLPPGAKGAASFLDLGTGNGSLLFGLRDAGWRGRMLGVDYSRRSVEFARRIARSRSTTTATTGAEAEEEEEEEGKEKDTEPEDVEFLEHDILLTPPSALLSGAQSRGWDVVLDKGTFDAVSLSSETDPARGGRRVGESYRARILPLVRGGGGLFLVTSCNWTEEELRGWFVGGGADEQEEDEEARAWKFEEVGKVEYPSFSFGGVKGQTISTLCFRKVRNPRS